MNEDGQQEINQNIFEPYYNKNVKNLQKHNGCSTNQIQNQSCQSQSNITYQIFGSHQVTKEIQLIDDIHLHFSAIMNKNESEIFVVVDKKVVRRGLNFQQMQNQMSPNAVYIIYDVEKLLEQLEDAQPNKKQQNSINETQITQNPYNRLIESKIYNSSTDFNQKTTQQQEQVEGIFESEIMNSLKKLIQSKENELEKLKIIHGQQMSFIACQSVLKNFESTCSYCNISIKAEICQTPCLHNFHEECFDAMVQSQIHNKKCKLECICGKYIPLKCMQQFIGNKFQADIYNQQFLVNQTEMIKEKYSEKIRSCQTNRCPFFFYYVHQRIKSKQTFCPLCLTQN